MAAGDTKPKRPAPPALSFTVRTASMRSEYKGGHAEGLRHLFVCLPDALARRQALDDLEKAHARCLEREEARAALPPAGEEPEQGLDSMGRLP